MGIRYGHAEMHAADPDAHGPGHSETLHRNHVLWKVNPIICRGRNATRRGPIMIGDELIISDKFIQGHYGR